MTLTYSELSALRHKMQNLQQDVHPLTPTVRQIAAAWGISSTSHATHLLELLQSVGMVKSIKRGIRRYWIVIEDEPSEVAINERIEQIRHIKHLERRAAKLENALTTAPMKDTGEICNEIERLREIIRRAK